MALATPAISTIMPMLSRCAFEGMRIPFKICAAARLCRGAGCCGPGPHDLEIRERFAFVPEADETNRRTSGSASILYARASGAQQGCGPGPHNLRNRECSRFGTKTKEQTGLVAILFARASWGAA